MAFRQMLGLAYLALCVILAMAMATGENVSLSGGHSLNIPYQNSSISGSPSSSALSTSSSVNVLSIVKESTFSSLSSTAKELSESGLDHPRSQTSDIVHQSADRASGAHMTTTKPISSQNVSSTDLQYPTAQITYVSSKRSSSMSLQASVGSADPVLTAKTPNETYSRLPSFGSSLRLPRTSAVSTASGSTKLDNSAVPSATHTSGTKGAQGWLNTQWHGSHRNASSNSVHPSEVFLGGTAGPSGRIPKQTMPLVTGMPGSTRNSTSGGQHVATLDTTGTTSMGANSSVLSQSPPSNASVGSPTRSNLTLTNLTLLSNSSTQSPIFANFTSPNTTFSNATLNSGLSSNSSMTNSTFASSGQTNLTLSDSLISNSTVQNLTIHPMTFTNLTLNSSRLSNSTSRNRPLTNSTVHIPWFIKDGNLSIPIPWQPVHPIMRNRAGATGYQLLTADQPTQCSGIVTKDIQKLTKTIITTTWVDETVTLFADAPTPFPVFISPLAPCSTSYLPFGPQNPGGPRTDTSTLLVTKKSPVVIRSPQTVGPIYNVPTTTAQLIPAQPATNGNQAFVPNSQQATSQEQGSGGSHEAQPGSNEKSGSELSSNDLSPGSAPLQQVFPEVLPSVFSGSGHPNLPQSVSEINDETPQGSNAQRPGGGQTIERGGRTSSGGRTSDDGNQASNGGQHSGKGAQKSSGGNAAGNGGHIPNEGQVSEPQSQSQASKGQQASSNGGHGSNSEEIGGGSQAPYVRQKPKGEGQMPGGKQAVGSEVENGGVSGTSGGQPVPESEHHPSDSGHMGAGQASSGQSDSNGHTSGSQNAGSGTSSSTGEGENADNGKTVGVGNSPTTPNGTSENENTGGTDSYVDQDIPNVIKMDNLPVSIGSSAIIVGSQTVDIGSLPTTVTANGQLITIQPTQVLGPGTTVPIKGAPTSPPATSTRIGGVPVVLHPDEIMIGSQTFSHGPSAAFAVYNGQTYSWDAKQFIGPGGTMVAFPSPTPRAPRLTAGGQVFSVFSSTLKASGTAFAIPDTPKASPFVYQSQTFSVNPSQLIAPARSITIPPATPPTPFVYDGQTFSVDKSRFFAPSATIPLSSGTGTVRYGTQVLTVDHTRIICPTSIITLSDAPQAGTAALPSAITTGGLAFSIGAQAAVVGSSTYSFLPGQSPVTVTSSGQTITLESSGVHFGDVSVPIPTPTSPPSYSAVTQGDLTFSAAPSAVILGSKTYQIGPNIAPAYTVLDGQTISLGIQGVGLASTTIPLPKPSSSYAVVKEGDLTFSVAPSAVVLGSQTYQIGPTIAPVHTVVNGQMINIGTQGVGLASTTIPLPKPSSNYAVVTDGDLIFSVAPSEAVIQGSTFAIGPDMPATMVLGGRTVSVGPNEIHFPGTTVDFPTATSQDTPIPVTVDGLTFSVGPTNVVIGNTAYAIGSGAVSKTVMIGSETIRLGSNGVILPSTTIAPEQTVSPITADGLTFSADATEAIINGTAYAIGSEAIAKTIVVGSETIGLGTKGIVLPSTTIQPWLNGTQSRLSSFYGTAAATGGLPSVAATTAPPPPIGLPGTSPEGGHSDIHRGTGSHLKPPGMLVLVAVIGGLTSSLLGLI